MAKVVAVFFRAKAARTSTAKGMTRNNEPVVQLTCIIAVIPYVER
jgi:hypothetical protein